MKIISESVGMKNFLSFGSKFQEIPLKNGINLVTGIDKDLGKSNGAGKSSFLETIPFALFGKVARDIKKEQIVNWKNRKNCEVIFKFSINENKYEILRAIKPDKFEIIKNGKLLDKEAHSRDYQEVFDDLFGMDVKMFMSLIHSNLNSSANILSMGKPEKRRFMERMFGLEIFSKMNDLCNDKLKNIESKFHEMEFVSKANIEKIRAAKQIVADLSEQIKNRTNYQILIEIKKDLLKKILNKTSLDKINQQMNDLCEAIATCQETLVRIKLKSQNIFVQIKEVDAQEGIIQQNEKIREELREFNDCYKNIESVDKAIKELKEEKQKRAIAHNDKIKELRKQRKEFDDNTEINNFDTKLKDLTKKLVENQTNLKTINKNLEMLTGGICPICKQDVTNPQTHYAKEASELNVVIEKLVNGISILEERKKDLNFKITADRKRLDDVIEKTEAEFFTDHVIDRSISDFELAKNKYYTLSSQLKDVRIEKSKQELTIELEELELERSRASTKMTEEKDKKESLQNTLISIQEIETEIKRLVSLEEADKKNVESFQKIIEDNKEIAKKTEAEIKENADKISKINNIKDYLNYIKDLLKDENIKQHMISQIIPYLNKQANDYLSKISYSFFINISKWLDVEIKGPGITKATYDSLSGGERRGIDIAIQLSFIDIGRIQAGIFPDLLILDELLDSSIDSKGISELMKIISLIEKDNEGKIFVISHREELDKDDEFFVNNYHIIKENSFSRVEF